MIDLEAFTNKKRLSKRIKKKGVNWIKILVINFSIFFVIIVSLEVFSGLSRVVLGKKFIFPHTEEADPCQEMKTDVLLSHVPNHLGRCEIKNGYVDGEYVRYNVSKLSNPVLLTLGGSTTSGFFQHISVGDTYPNYLSQFLVNEYLILNGGVGSYSSLQELYKVIRDVPRIKNLHTVISLNGINEDQHFSEIWQSEFPFLTPVQVQMNIMQTWIDQRIGGSFQSFLPNLNSLIRYFSIVRTTNSIINDNLTLSDFNAFDAADRWLINVTRIHAILQAHGVRYYVFLQPTMGLEGPQSSPLSGSADEKLFQLISDSYIQNIRKLYSGLKRYCLKLTYCFDISDEVPPIGNVYNDIRHHNSEGNRLLAKIIADVILEQDRVSSPLNR